MTVLIKNHDRIRAGGDMRIETLLHPRCSGKDHIPIGGGVNRFFGKSDCLRRRASLGIGLFADHADVLLGDRFFQAFAFLLVNEYRELVRLNEKARIKDTDVTVENSDPFLGIERRFVGINLGRNRLPVIFRRRQRVSSRFRVGCCFRFGRGFSRARRVLSQRIRTERENHKASSNEKAIHFFGAEPPISFWL